jgi:hypothetical protein
MRASTPPETESKTAMAISERSPLEPMTKKRKSENALGHTARTGTAHGSGDGRAIIDGSNAVGVELALCWPWRRRSKRRASGRVRNLNVFADTLASPLWVGAQYSGFNDTLQVKRRLL